MKRNNQSTSSNGSFHTRSSILSELLTSVKLMIYSCSRHHHCKSVVHSGSMIDIIIRKKYFIVLHCALVHCGIPLWFFESGYYHRNTRSFFSTVKNDYTIDNEKTEIILSEKFCKLDKCPVCKNNTNGLVTNNCPLIDLRNLKSYKDLK